MLRLLSAALLAGAMMYAMPLPGAQAQTAAQQEKMKSLADAKAKRDAAKAEKAQAKAKEKADKKASADKAKADKKDAAAKAKDDKKAAAAKAKDDKKAAAAKAKAEKNAQKSDPKNSMKASAERRKQCGAEWKAARAAGQTKKTDTWPKFYSTCNTRLKAA